MAASPREPSVFKLERYYAKYEFTVRHQLSCSDAESMPVSELLEHAEPVDRDAWDNLRLGYTESDGHPDLLAAITEAFYPSLDPRSDVLCCVPQEGIHLVMRSLIDFISHSTEGPWHAISMRPAYQSLTEWLECSSVSLSLWTPCDSDPTRWEFEIEALKGLVQANTRVVVLNFPHNPTGYAPTEQDWEQLILWLHERDIIVFSDEMYRYTVADPSRTPVLRPACELSPTAITLCGLSKSFGMPGLRSGWLATRNRVVLKRCRELKDYLTICGCGPGEILSIIAVKSHGHFTSRINAIVAKNLQSMDEFMMEFNYLFCWRRPSSGLVGLLEMQKVLLDRFEGAEKFCDAVREGCEVLLVPSSCMNYGYKFVRIGFGRSDFARVLHIFAEFLRAQQIPHN